MREIKFRAFYKGKMRDVLCVDWLNRFVDISGGLIEIPFEELELMQYTGINGSIWEGDIVRDISNGNAYIVEYNQSQGNFGLAEVLDVRKLWSFYGFGSPGPYEVIGNRFENPELLEDMHND